MSLTADLSIRFDEEPVEMISLVAIGVNFSLNESV
tara:strand:+ start:52 stop:156 length:105 start_codon:yes stop_codon:yes gene_type:complete